VSVPVWLTYLVAFVVFAFGFYRLKIAFRSKEEDNRLRAKKGLYALPRRTHFLFGALYLLLGAFLIASALGVVKSPFGGDSADSVAPSSGSGGASQTIPIETR